MRTKPIAWFETLLVQRTPQEQECVALSVMTLREKRMRHIKPRQGRFGTFTSAWLYGADDILRQKMKAAVFSLTE